MMDDGQKAELKTWLKKSRFTSWNDLLDAIPDTRPEWKWVASVTLPRHRNAFLEGRITNKVPLPVPIPGWIQRTQVQLNDVSINRGGKILQSDRPPTTYCYGRPPVLDSNGNPTNKCSEQVDGASFHTGFVRLQ
jgi:hypothetical protein